MFVKLQKEEICSGPLPCLKIQVSTIEMVQFFSLQGQASSAMRGKILHASFSENRENMSLEDGEHSSPFQGNRTERNHDGFYHHQVTLFFEKKFMFRHEEKKWYFCTEWHMEGAV